MWDDLTFGKKTKEKRKKKKRKISKKKEKGKKIIATKNPSSSLISTHTSRKRYANALSPSLSRKSRSVSFPRFLDARKRAVFLAFFFRARHTPHAFARAKRRWWVDYPRKKNKKNNHHRKSKCVLARKIIAPTGPRATRLGDSTRAKRAERMRSNPFLSRSVSTVVAKWVGAGVRRSVFVVKRR